MSDLSIDTIHVTFASATGQTSQIFSRMEFLAAFDAAVARQYDLRDQTNSPRFALRPGDTMIANGTTSNDLNLILAYERLVLSVERSLE